ncbi:MAG: outer membrane lipoprotein-sorting protein [Arenicellales bacterium]|nr:outer membrane lipoprotein-sorting protein [Arenicellales bacterium]
MTDKDESEMPRKSAAVVTACLFFCCLNLFSAAPAQAIDASAIIKAAIDHWRGASSHSIMAMTVHRPGWQRSMTMEAWTAGDKESLVRVLTPKKDAGNATLLRDNKMWVFSPKVNRVIKIPSSLMNQSWMGSDFSNKDIARSADIIEQFTHTLIDTEHSQGHQVFVIQSIPKEDAPVVWGKERLRIRDDYVMLEHTFYDQDMNPVKRMDTSRVGVMGGRMVAIQERMAKLETPEQYTEIRLISVEFDIETPRGMFTLSNLRNPRF